MKNYSILDNLVFLNIKTTGNDNKIVEICAIKIKTKVVTKFNTLVKSNLVVFLEDLPIVCHNAAYIESFLEPSNKFLDPLELFAILFPEFPDFNLQYLAKRFLPDYKVEKPSCLIETELTIKLINYAISSFFDENGYTLPISLTELEAWDWYKFLTNVNMDEVKAYSENRLIVSQDNTKIPYPVFALKDYEKLFEREDLWRRSGRSYTLRTQQKYASKFIREGLEKGKITIMEAPTGLGKSLAYLLPTAIYTHLKEEKVIISTNTKGLQNQLVEKDIPSLLEALNLKGDVKYTLMKGKNNYLCYDRFKDI